MLNKIKNIKLSKSKYIYTVIAGLIIIAIGTTFAWWRWSSDINALVNGKVCAPEIVFVGGTTINGTDLLPVRTKEEGLSKDINVNLNNTCDNDTAVLNLNLKPDVLPEGLADSSFKWALYKVTTEEVQGVLTENLTYVNDGNFNGKRQYVNDNDLISIATDLIVTENISTYRLFIWIDGTMDNASTMGDNFFKFSIYGTGKDAIYREYVMKKVSNSSATASFWGSPINANQVKSIRFISSNQVSDEWTNTYDLSSVSDSSDVTMYYVQNGQTEDANPITLYDVYVASNNGGLVKANTDGYRMFAFLTNCEYIDAEGLDTSNVIEMSSMFRNSKMTQLKISNWDTSKVQYMRGMFRDCTNLQSLDVSGFDTSSVLAMGNQAASTYGGMFQNCSSLEELDLTNFDFSNNTNMDAMFYGCTNLKHIKFPSDINTSKVSRMEQLFSGCSSLMEIDISNFDTSKVQYMSGMFKGCSSLQELDVSHLKTSSVTGKNMENIFFGCSNLRKLDVTNFDTSNITSTLGMFSGCSGLTSIDVSHFDTSNVTTMRNMFYRCSGLTALDLSNFNTERVTSIYGMFQGCNHLTDLDLSVLSIPLLDDMMYTFQGCSSLQKLNISSFDLSLITANISGGTGFMAFHSTPSNMEIIVKDCTQYNKFVELFGNSYTNLHTVNNDNCTV